MTHDAEVIVVGGGPAGATAAAALAGRGVRTRLLDRKRFPRDKPCGGGARYGLLRRFPALAGWLDGRVALHEIRRVHMEAPSGASVVAELASPLYLTFRRLEFDAALVERARRAGAEVIEDARVVALERAPDGVRARCYDGRAFAAALVIGADGVNSVVAREAGLTRGFPDAALAVDTMEETPLAELAPARDDTMYVAYGWRGWPGYGYVFPKRHHVDAGVGFMLPFFRSLAGAPYDHHARFLDEARARGTVRGRSNPANFKAYRLPLGGPLARTVGERVLLCGDAGGFVNAYTGEGIYHAMVTGEHAAVTAADALAAGDCGAARLARYEARWRAEIGEELADSVRIQRRLFANPRLADAIIGAAAVDRKLCRLFALIALGEKRLRPHKLEMAWRFSLAALRRRLRLTCL
ncbi:MAG: NAD(P)/FAD-dependent oxidoreductase [Candidatus Rokuibacteriota bacterium]